MSKSNKSGLKWRVYLSLGLLALYVIALNVFQIGQGPIEGSIALGQLNGGDAEYALARAAITSHSIPTISSWIFFGSMVIVWVTYLFKYLRNNTDKENS